MKRLLIFHCQEYLLKEMEALAIFLRHCSLLKCGSKYQMVLSFACQQEMYPLLNTQLKFFYHHLLTQNTPDVAINGNQTFNWVYIPDFQCTKTFFEESQITFEMSEELVSNYFLRNLTCIVRNNHLNTNVGRTNSRVNYNFFNREKEN